MELRETEFDLAVDDARSSALALPTSIEAVHALSDGSLVDAQTVLAEIRRAVDACSSLVAGEIAVRSRRDLGFAGLAQREGLRTPEALVQHATGATSRDASTLVKVGGMVHGALDGASPDGPATADSPASWTRPIGAAVNAGAISVEEARAIRTGLGDLAMDGTPNHVSPEVIADAVDSLLVDATILDADQLLRRARELRDELDAAGIADRERRIHLDRGIRRVRRENGVNRYIVDPDLESGAFWDDLYDRITSPRRGGPRFVDAAEKQRAEDISTDPRTLVQFVHDSITELLRIGSTQSGADSRRVVGARAPSVRVLVTATSLTNRSGHGRIEGCDTPISIETVERMVCSVGTVAITFDDEGQVINLGREQRLFTPHQRAAMAARDGGCLVDGCDRPPNWTEAHHIEHWTRDHGETNIADGVLLCRYHHLLVHNNHWEIERRRGTYWLIPPPDVDPDQWPRPMPSKSAALHDLRRGA